MPWGDKTVENLREDFVNEVKRGYQTKSGLCAKYGISRVTGDKWLKRFEKGEGLSNHSRAPFKTPLKTETMTEAKIIQVRQAHPVWGARKIIRYLQDAGVTGLPSPSTVCDILKRNGLVTKEASQAATPYRRFERERPNELWQADFKGYILMENGCRCHPLTVLDDHSRYSLCVDAKDNERYDGVVLSFKRLFEEYGLPDSLLCDNGNPWGTSQSVGYTRFEVWLMQHDVLTIHGRPGHPQTQGKEERFHRTLKAEALKNVTITDLAHAQDAFDCFRRCYNSIRPHGALNLDTPSSRYAPSQRRMNDVVRDFDYPHNYKVLKVKSSGYITLRSQGYFLSEAFSGLVIAMRESSLAGCVNLYYRNFRIARINIGDRSIARKAYRTEPDD